MASITFNDIEDLPPPILLLSEDGEFKGLKNKYTGKADLQIKIDE